VKVVIFMLGLVVGAFVFLMGEVSTAGSSSYNRANVSWYGPGLYGNHLACGGRLSTSTWGVANKSLRCGTIVRLCYSRCVNARVIDRGPYVYGRTFDLTYPVKIAIGMGSRGTATIRYSVVR
jgi:rare lipoprotein A